jgi:hypothetical protein
MDERARQAHVLHNALLVLHNSTRPLRNLASAPLQPYALHNLAARFAQDVQPNRKRDAPRRSRNWLLHNCTDLRVQFVSGRDAAHVA